MTRVRITELEDELVTEVRYLNAARGGGTAVDRLPVQRAAIGPLGDELDAIVVCSDLQGMVSGHAGEAELLGVHVADVIEELAFDRVLPPAARTGVILAGDLFSVPEANKRGGRGRVADVWRAFAERFAWVAGVAGNHDDVTGVAELGTNVHLLDGNVVELDTVRIGGVAVNEIQHWAFDAPDPMDSELQDASYQTTSVYGHGHPLFYDNVIRTLRGEAHPDTDGREGLKSLELLIAMYLSARDGKRVNLPLAY